DRTVWAASSSPDSSAQRDVVRVAEEDAHLSRLPFVPGVHSAFWSDFVSHARRARRDVQSHGAVESPRALGGFCTGACPRILPRPSLRSVGVSTSSKLEATMSERYSGQLALVAGRCYLSKAKRI